MKNFNELDLHPVMMTSLAQMNYHTPTPVQAQAIPPALDGRDILGSAQTGTGKTAAFAIPLIEKLLRNPRGTALVLTPTRELGKQIMEIMHQLLGRKSPIKTAFIIGGESMGKQYAQLKQQPRLIVGTPGRINDHLQRGSMKLHDTDFLVLDETDRMLDMGFTVQIDRILHYMPKKRQTLLFSATLPPNILKLSEKYLNNAVRVAVGSTTTPLKAIRQETMHLDGSEKYDALVNQLNARSGSIIIFVKTKYGTEKLAKKLNRENHDAEAIHGDLKQSRRERVISGLRNKKYRILVATDVVARGLDIPHIAHVINYDLPQVAEDYIHRIGRTARAGAEGASLSLVTPQDRDKWYAISVLMDPSLKGKPGAAPSKGASSKNGGRHKRRFAAGNKFRPRKNSRRKAAG